MTKNNWARGPESYIQKRLNEPSPVSQRRIEDNKTQTKLCGITWERADLGLEKINQFGVEKARSRFRASLPDLIWNAAALEGNNYTLPEVQTLLDGVTVGGKPVEDEEQILALSEGYSLIDELVRDGKFELSKAVSDRVHGIVARHEAIESGHFRGEGSVNGGGHVRLSHGGIYSPTESDDGGAALREEMDALIEYLEARRDPRETAIAYFAAATRYQFYFDGNKRTARLMMTGFLLQHGFDAVNIPFARKLEFNIALDALFDTADATQLMSFLASCATKS